MANKGEKTIVNNRKVHFNYFLSDFKEAGIVLHGTEIKALRAHGCDLNDAFVLFRNQEAFIVNMYIAPYEKGNIFNHEPLRDRKLLLHKLEIRRMMAAVKEDGYTIVPTRVYLKDGRAKVEIALGKGKKLYDKRATIKKRDDDRRMAAARKGDRE